MKYLACDIETSGFSLGISKPPDEIISIGWCDVDQPLDEFGETFAFPVVAQSSVYALRVHQLSEQVLKRNGATDLATALKPLLSTIEAIPDVVVLVAHNGYSFDSRFIAAALRAHNLSMPANFAGWIDTSRLDWGAGKLDDVAKRLNVTITRTTHGALVDARLLADVFLAGCKQAQAFPGKSSRAFETTHDWLKRTADLPKPPTHAKTTPGTKRPFAELQEGGAP